MNRRKFLLLNQNNTASGLPWVTRSGNKLLANGSDFRFAGTNIYWLGTEFREAAAWGINTQVYQPSHFRVDDALGTAKLMGCNVIRAISLGWSVGTPGALLPVLGGAYNEDAFLAMDYAIYKAGQLGLYLIIPLCDNYNYYWGTMGFFGADFFTNETTIAAFRAYVSTILNRVNTYNGIAYKNDPTILAWESGNELISPDDWTTAFATYIKTIDSRHLFSDARAANASIGAARVADNDIDIIQTHYYPMSVAELNVDLGTTNLSNKVFIVGEWDWNGLWTPASDLSTFMDAMLNAEAVRGDMFWCMAAHADTYGWWAYANDYTGSGHPNDVPSDMMFGAANMETSWDLMRAHNYAMRGLSVPAYPTLAEAPVLSKTGDLFGAVLTWKGVTGAKTYSMERSTTSASAGFAEVATGLTDGYTTDNAGITNNGGWWNDADVPASGNTIWYRVRGLNGDSAAGPYSNVVSVAVPANTLQVSDAFTDTDATALTDHVIAPTNVPETAWQHHSGTWQITSNKAVWATKPGSNLTQAVVETGLSDVIIIADVTYKSVSSKSSSIVVRAQDANNYLTMSLYLASAYIQHFIAGNQTNDLIVNVGLAGTATYPVVISVQGTTLQFTVNGHTLVHTSALYETETEHGIANYSSVVIDAEAFDNFKVYG